MGNTKVDKLKSFQDTYFKSQNDYYYMFEDYDFSVSDVTAYKLIGISNETKYKNMLESDIDAYLLSSWINDNDDLYFYLYDLTLDAELKEPLSDLDGPATIILMDNEFKVFLDTDFSKAQVEVR